MTREGGELTPGIYESLVDTEVRARIDGLTDGLTAEVTAVDVEDFPQYATHHISRRVKTALARAGQRERVELANEILRVLPDHDLSRELHEGPDLLTAVFDDAPVQRPSTPLTETALFTNAAGTPSLNSELRLEMSSADRVDLLCAFVKWSGITVLEKALAKLRDRGVPIRVLTTTYIGATERRALDRLVDEYGAEVRVNFDARTTHLHAKAWLFYRRSGFDTGYVGSSNLSRTALVDGVEWNVRVSREATPTLMDNFDATFESYWSSSAFEAYTPSRDGARLDRALGEARNGGRERDARNLKSGITTHFLDVRPFPHQAEMLEELAAERSEGQRSKNLLVAATGTGKTVVAALDYARLLREWRQARKEAGQPAAPLRLLFVAHRREILEQAVDTYRSVLKQGDFGSMLIGGAESADRDHVFASVQMLSRDSQLTRWDADHFDVVVIDEFHHAEAATYRRILEWFQPQQLLGLTATPERADGVNVALEFFGGRIASELRLWDALEADLLVPFHYFGVADNVDLTDVTFRAGGYDVKELSRLYTGNDNRAALIIEEVGKKVLDPEAMRALGFCVTVDHARYMSEAFNGAGIRSVVLSGESRTADRDAALRQLRSGDIQCIFTVDLFNEGVDVPEIDTVLMLRPTQSATIFLQQLGRGLRRATGKALLTVLDFVGHQHARFRFDIKLRALTGLPRGKLVDALEKGFPQMPGGSQIVLDRVAEENILRSIKSQLSLSTKELVVDLRQHKPDDTRPEDFRLADYLSRAGRGLPDIYRSSGTRSYYGDSLPSTWSAVHHWAFDAVGGSPSERGLHSLLMRRVVNFTHVDDADRVRSYTDVLKSDVPSTDLISNPFAAMLYFSFWPTGPVGSMAEGLDEIRANPALCDELSQLLTVTQKSVRSSPRPLEGSLAQTPLKSHARYSREELFAALGVGVQEKATPGSVREGVKWVDGYDTDVLLVTLHKSDADFSPSTQYRDYALSPTLFHWESQSVTGDLSPTGQRYINHRGRGSKILLFVRMAKNGDLGTEPYTCLGTAQYVSHQGSKPIQFVWELDRPMPTDIYLAAKAVA
ncbi:MAG: DUF3427 domain-containing protein [Brevibacterium yomogidense]|uniref:DUF3427 domain-containing protein n=1 Tax=Brevibacterium aurantiacum TaxID=273384 RepID=UPI003F924AC9